MSIVFGVHVMSKITLGWDQCDHCTYGSCIFHWEIELAKSKGTRSCFNKIDDDEIQFAGGRKICTKSF